MNAKDVGLKEPQNLIKRRGMKMELDEGNELFPKFDFDEKAYKRTCNHGRIAWWPNS